MLPLSDLPVELFRRIISCVVSPLDAWPSRRFDSEPPPLAAICTAASLSKQWQDEIEAMCKSALGRSRLTFVPLDKHLIWPSGKNFTLPWRARFALGFEEIFMDARRLSQLGAGLTIIGAACAQGFDDACKTAECVADILTRAAREDGESSQRECRVAWASDEKRAAVVGPDTRGQRGRLVDVKRISELPPPHTWAGPQDMETHVLCVEIPCVCPSLGGLPLKVIDTLMENLISEQVMVSPWYVATGRSMAFRLGGRPALPTSGPIIMVETRPTSDMELPFPEPETLIQLLSDYEEQRVIGKATIRYTTRTGKPGPTLCTFEVPDVAADYDTLVEAAILADTEHHDETRDVLAAVERAAPADTIAQRNLLAARILLFRGVEAFVSWFCDPQNSYHWPFRVEDGLPLVQNLQFLRWRGLRERRGFWCSFLGSGENTFYYDEDDPVMAAEWEQEMRLNDYENDEEVQEAVRQMEDAEREGVGQLTVAQHAEMRRKARRLNQTVRGRRLGRAVAAAHFIPLRTETEKDETEGSDDE